MSGILCFRNFMSSSLWSPSAADAGGSGSADAAHPASAMIDGRTDTYWRRTGTTTANLTGVFGNTFTVGYCVFGLVGVQAITNAGDELPISVRLRVGTGAGLGDIYDARRRIVANNAVGELNAPANAFFVVDTLPLDDSSASVTARACGGKYTGTVYLTWTLTNGGTSANWTVREMTAWSGFAGRVKPNRVWDGVDPSDLQRSYGGAEFSNLKNPKRMCTVTMTDLDDKQIRGGTRGPTPAGSVAYPVVTANVNAINRHAGIARPVVWVPNSNIGNDAYTDPFEATGRDWNADMVAQSEIIYGFLTKPLQGRELGRIDSDESFWETDFTIVDAFNGLT